MGDSNLQGSELLKTILEPLLEDFQYWFDRSRNFLETEQISFMSNQEQSDLLRRVKEAQSELNTAKTHNIQQISQGINALASIIK